MDDSNQAPTQAAGGNQPPTIPAPHSESPGDDIGPYRLLELLGEGGFGSVYLAERRGAIIQRVALKVIKPGMDSRAVIARFEQERQALALLDHPSIARVFDAGTTEQGRPYFVMELVRGKPLTEYAAARGLSVRERLSLLAAVAHAMQHAHQRGLVHRDLKPSNILVAEHDDQPLPKVIDFGVVKALQASLTDKTIHTSAGQAIGTVEYMSPEQANPVGGDVDARSDVYSLGIILFELLTGRLPYDPAKLRAVSPSDIPKLLELLRPIRAGHLDASLKGEIETIILKASHPEPERRYQSAGDLAADIERFLAGEPIRARPDSVAYVASTRIRRAARHGGLAIVISAWALAIIIAIYPLNALLFQWTTLGGKHERVMAWAAAALAPAPAMDRVRVINLDDNTTQTQLAAAAGVAGVTDESLQSLRVVHGAMLKRLAQAHPAVVVIDISFSRTSEFDGALAEGLAALDAAKVPWVAKITKWPLDDAVPQVADVVRLKPTLRYGGGTAEIGVRFIYADAAMRRSGGAVAPSIALLAYGAVRRPMAQLDFALDATERRLDVIYYKIDDQAPSTRLPAALPDHILLTGVQPVTKSDARSGVQPGDLQALYEILVPPDSVLDARSMSYAKALEAGERLTDWAAGQVVVIGDARAAGGDVHRLPDGRMVPGPFIVAATIDQMLAGRSVVTPNSTRALQVLLLVSLAGAIVGAMGRWHVGKRWITLVAMGGLVVGVCVLSYALAGVMCNPTPPVFAMLIASEAAALGGAALLGPQRRLLQEKRV